MPRLLHFTDMHLRHHQPGTATNPKRLSRSMLATLERLEVEVRDLEPDVVVMTGDLLDIPDEVIFGGSPDGRSNAQWLVEAAADFQLVKDWFDGIGVPYLVIPGNHDHEATFKQVFGDTKGPRDEAGFRFFSFWDQLAADRQPERIDTSADLFHAALNAPEHDCFQIHLQHYMIDPPTFSRGSQYEYKNAAKMKHDIEKCGRVRAVLSGHYHPGSLVVGAGDIIHSLPPAFCEAPHTFRIYDFDDITTPVIKDLALDP